MEEPQKVGVEEQLPLLNLKEQRKGGLPAPIRAVGKSHLTGAMAFGR